MFAQSTAFWQRQFNMQNIQCYKPRNSIKDIKDMKAKCLSFRIRLQQYRNTSYRMGCCQNSRLITFDTTDKQPQQDTKTKQGITSASRQVLYECQDNTLSANGKSIFKNNQGLSICIMPEDEAGKQTFHRKKGKELVKKTVDLIQELQYTSKASRLKKYDDMETEEQFFGYFDDIRHNLMKKEEMIKQIMTEIDQCGCKKFAIHSNEVTQFIQGYLNEEKASLSETRTWLKEKIAFVKKEGKALAKRLKTASSKWKDTESLPQILSIAIEDRLSSSRPFFLSLAYDFQFQNLLDEKLEWQQTLLPIYTQLYQQ